MSNQPQGNATPLSLLELLPVPGNHKSEFVAKLRWIIRAAKNADGLIDAVELEKVVDQYNAK